MTVATPSIKQMAHDVIDRLPEDITWKGLSYELSILQDIEEGLADSHSGRIVSTNEVRRRFGLSELAE